MTERELQIKCLKYLDAVGIFAWRNNTQGIRGPNGRRCTNPAKGSPDILGILPTGTLLGIEVKKPGGKLSEDQIQWLAKAKANNATVLVVDNFEELVNYLSKIRLTR